MGYVNGPLRIQRRYTLSAEAPTDRLPCSMSEKVMPLGQLRSSCRMMRLPKSRWLRPAALYQQMPAFQTSFTASSRLVTSSTSGYTVQRQPNSTADRMSLWWGSQKAVNRRPRMIVEMITGLESREYTALAALRSTSRRAAATPHSEAAIFVRLPSRPHDMLGTSLL